MGLCALMAGCANEERNGIIGGADNTTGIVVTDSVRTVTATATDRAEQPSIVDSALIIVDDKEVTKEEVSGLNRDSIASVTVLKDSAGIALYGEKGKNGVVYIKTKKGGEGSEDAGDASK